MAGLVGAALHLGQKLFPFMARLAVIVPVGAGMLAAMVEEADVVVFALERPDLALDELVELAQIGRDLRGDVEVHGVASAGDPTGRAGRCESGCRRRLPPSKLPRRRGGARSRAPGPVP